MYNVLVMVNMKVRIHNHVDYAKILKIALSLSLSHTHTHTHKHNTLSVHTYAVGKHSKFQCRAVVITSHGTRHQMVYTRE